MSAFCTCRVGRQPPSPEDYDPNSHEPTCAWRLSRQRENQPAGESREEFERDRAGETGDRLASSCCDESPLNPGGRERCVLKKGHVGPHVGRRYMWRSVH